MESLKSAGSKLVSINFTGGEATYPKNHVPGMRVPKGGSSCAVCEYLGKDKKTCKNKYFIKWNGSNKLPFPADEYCSDYFEPKEKK